MKWNVKINVTAILVFVAGVALFFWLNGNKNKKIQTHLNTIAHNEFVFETLRSEVDSLQIVQQEALDVSAEALKQALVRDSVAFELIEHYKKLSNVIKIETKYVHDTVKVSVPVHIKDDTTVNLADNCFSGSLFIENGAISLNLDDIHNRQDIVIGDRRTGLFKTDQYISIHNTNPCITVTGMQTYNIVYEKKWWENPLITVPAGIAIGLVGSQFIK